MENYYYIIEKQQKFVNFKFKKALEQLAQKILSNHRYEVHSKGGETEVIMDIHVVIVHNNLILIFSLLL